MGNGGFDRSQEPHFFIPSYLKGTRHAERLLKAHKSRLRSRTTESAKSATSTGGTNSLSTSSSSINLHQKMVPSHRGMTHDIIEKAPTPIYEDAVAQLPSCWNRNDKWAGLEIEGGGLEVIYRGASKTHVDEAAAVRSDRPMPRECGIYYFEITIMSKGKENKPSLVSIGFSGPKVILSRLPGWEPNSWAYHGDDGNTFNCTASGRPYGHKYNTSDVIGCGVNFRTGEAFFTRNGHYLGTAFTDIKAVDLYPSVGMKKPNEHLRVNFGQSPFCFEIDSLVEAERRETMDLISSMPVTGLCPPLNETQLIHQLIAQYLAHDGYIDTARAFAEEVRQENKNLTYNIPGSDSEASKDLEPEEDVDAIQRQKIRASILDGDIDRALKLINIYYPTVLSANEPIYFKLRCRKFIEMIRHCAELSDSPSPITSKNNTSSDSYNGVFSHQMELDESNGFEDGMDTSDDLSNSAIGGVGIGLDGNQTFGNSSSNGNSEGNGFLGYGDLMNKTLEYGRELKDEFDGDGRGSSISVRKTLEDTLALIAYSDPREGPLRALLDVEGRIPIAEELNGAILVSLGKSSSSSLERLFAQTDVLLSECGADGSAGALINLRSI
ncbi:SPRY-domain-containing protein [Tothia fuscella]|uniref:SPRY-domain-containing protein n=1 Tax=Tothia fuscella TaxID=1048955 RepID=A0A9P4TYM3_9PEZI|nr:SPRY-domain-containing protein [Tothia fuscella]